MGKFALDLASYFKKSVHSCKIISVTALTGKNFSLQVKQSVSKLHITADKMYIEMPMSVWWVWFPQIYVQIPA
jgi:hypothetical protein